MYTLSSGQIKLIGAAVGSDPGIMIEMEEQLREVREVALAGEKASQEETKKLKLGALLRLPQGPVLVLVGEFLRNAK
jgi:hypothetical protein